MSGGAGVRCGDRAAAGALPYLTRYSGEQILRPRVVVAQRQRVCLGYADEVPYDRDDTGVLWVRVAIRPAGRRGVPQLRKVHPFRQRRAMLDLLCQVCGRPAEAGDGGPYLFLLGGRRRVREGEPTASPPVCLPCARVAVRECPHLRRHAAAWVGRASLWGVAGVRYDPKTLRAVPGRELEMVAFGSPAVRWMQVARTVVSLHGVVPADLTAPDGGVATPGVLRRRP